MSAEDTRFKQDNKAAQKWTLENAEPLFLKALDFAKSDDDCLCVQDAISESGIPYVTFYYLADKHPVLNDIKTSINNEVIRRINRGALKGDFNPASSIWRMKQLGERDKQEIEHSGGLETKRIVDDL